MEQFLLIRSFINNTNTKMPSMDDTDDSIMYASSYALVTILLMFLDYIGVPTSDFDMVFHWISSLVLTIACLILLKLTLNSLGKALLPDDHETGRYLTWFGAVLGMHISIIYATLSHKLDDKMFFYQLFWVQILALPGAYVTARFLGNLLDCREESLWKIGAYRLVNLMLWLDLQNSPIPEGETPFMQENRFPFGGWVLSLLTLVLLDVFFLIESIVQDFNIRSARNPKAKVLLTIGTITGVVIMLGIMVPLELKFHFLKDKPWVYFILIAELGALPGAHLIGNSAWLAKIYAGRQPTLPGYSKISEEEEQV